MPLNTMKQHLTKYETSSLDEIHLHIIIHALLPQVPTIIYKLYLSFHHIIENDPDAMVNSSSLDLPTFGGKYLF